VKFWIDVETSAGAKLGSGPITSASNFRFTSRIDRSGSFSFALPASDEKAALVQVKRVVRAYAILNGQRVNVGSGVIDLIEHDAQPDGTVILRVSGSDLLRELTYRSVQNLKLYSNNQPVSQAVALAAVEAYAPTGWSFAPDASPPNDSVYAYFGGESVLSAIIKIADKTYSHFVGGLDRTVAFSSDFASSGIRAVQARGHLPSNICAITNLVQKKDVADLITRTYPRGSGNAEVQLTLRATDRTAPAGFENDDAVSTYGVIERWIDYRDVGPISNTATDIQSAANALFDAAIEELRRRSTELEQSTYTMQIAGCSQLLRPMQSIHVVYRNSLAGLDINADLNILEATWQVDSSGVHTTALQVSNADRWPKSDVGTIVDDIEQGHVYQALPQLNANSYVTAYTKNIDADEIAAFRFRFGNEVTQLQQVLFEFQLLPFESTVKNVAGSTTTSSSGGGSVQSASSGGSHTHSVTIPSHSHTVTIAAHSHTVTIAAHSHTVTIAAHNHTVTVAAHTHTVSIASHTHTVSIAAHSHNIPVYDTPSPGSPSNSAMMFDRSNDIFVISVSGTGNPDYGTTTDSGGSSTPTTASGGSQTPTSSSGGSQSPTSSTQAQTTPSSSTLSQTTPSSSTQAQTTPSSSLASQSVETSSTNGAHTHAVTIPSHTHTLTPVITTVYGIFRADVEDTYEVDELEYQINSGGWQDLETDSADAGSGWYALDITGDVYDSTTYRPLQASNLLEIRAKLTGSLNISTWNLSSGYLTITTSSAHGIEQGDIIEIVGQSLTGLGVNLNGEYTVYAVGGTHTFIVPKAGALESGIGDGAVRRHKTATIDAQLSVRNTIQAIAYV